MDTLRHGGIQIVEHGSIEVFEWKRRGQMERDFGFHFTNTPGLPAEHPAQAGDFQDAILQGIKLGVGPRCVAQPDLSQGVHQHIGGVVEKEPEVIGLEGVARGAIGMEKGLVIFDEAFHPAACAISGFVDE